MPESATQPKNMTAEYYDDPSGVHMIGAFYVSEKRANEHAEMMGKLLCKIRKVNSVEVSLYNHSGELVDKITVYR